MSELLPIPEALDGERLDVAAASLLCLTRSAVQRLLTEGHIRYNDCPAEKNLRVCAGDILSAEVPEPQVSAALPQDIPLSVVYEDDALLVVDKPKGMVVHPAPGNPDGTLVNALLWHSAGSLSAIGGVIRPGIVHRIDKDTSGLLVVAKTNDAHLCLTGQIKAHTVHRVYEAILHGKLREQEGLVDAPIGRHPTDRKKMAIVSDGRNAVTHYRVLEEFPGFCRVECRLETGRTHQIRVHMASLGHPVAGDPLYGPKKPVPGSQGQYLHAGLLGFIHPTTGEYMEFCTPPPEDFQKFLTKLRGLV